MKQLNVARVITQPFSQNEIILKIEFFFQSSDYDHITNESWSERRNESAKIKNSAEKLLLSVLLAFAVSLNHLAT